MSNFNVIVRVHIINPVLDGCIYIEICSLFNDVLFCYCLGDRYSVVGEVHLDSNLVSEGLNALQRGCVCEITVAREVKLYFNMKYLSMSSITVAGDQFQII